MREAHRSNCAAPSGSPAKRSRGAFGRLARNRAGTVRAFAPPTRPNMRRTALNSVRTDSHGMPRIPRRPSLGTIIQRYLAACDERVTRKALTRSSRIDIQKRLEHSSPLWDLPADAEALSEARLSAWLRTLADRPATARLAARTLRQALLWARTAGLVVGDLVACVVTPPHRAKRGEPFTRDDLLTFLGSCEDEFRRRARGTAHLSPLQRARHTAASTALIVLALTGLRSAAVGEALIADYDAIGRTLLVRTKGKVVRIPLTPEVAAVLDARVALIGDRHTHLFPGQRRGVGLSSNTLNVCFKRIANAGGVRDRRHCNDLRHTAVTLLREAGASWLEVTELFGHSNPVTTKKVYDHSSATPSARRTAASLVAYLGLGEGVPRG